MLLAVLALALTPEQTTDIGARVWGNECAGTIEGLLGWNEGEEFASLGIGHFIWHPPFKQSPFTETFPRLLEFFRTKGIKLPKWMKTARGCPWKTRQEFRKALQTPKMNDLRRLLKETVPLQAEFMTLRVDEAIRELLAKAPEEKRPAIQARYEALAGLPNGLYALVDYVNFKGCGTSPKETYAGEGWGLFQVLSNMSDDNPKGISAEFVRSAKEALEKRVMNAPKDRNEQHYLIGWFRRLDSYLE